MNRQKMTNSANTFDTIAKVAGGISKAGAIVCAVFLALVLILGEKVFAAGSLFLDLDFVKLHLADSFQTVTPGVKLYAALSLLAAGVLCIVLSYICGLIRALLAPMKEGRPFEAGAPVALRRIAWAIIAGGALSQIMGVVERFVLTRAYPMEEIFSSSAISRVEYAFTVDLGFVLLGCVVLLLSYIFSYGQALQRESDETL